MTGERCAAIISATDNLSLDELSDLIDLLENGTLIDIQKQPWGHHISDLLPAEEDADGIHVLWALLTETHNRRFSKQYHIS